MDLDNAVAEASQVERMCMLISSLPINDSLCCFSEWEKQEIKEFLRQHHKRNPSWRKIALRINNLMEDHRLSSNERLEIQKRFRYYLIMSSKRGRPTPSSADIENAAFIMSKDTLSRWIPESPQKSTKRSREPDSQSIAAIRDYLVVEGYMVDRRGEESGPISAFLSLLNSYSNRITLQEELPDFEENYVSFERDGNSIKRNKVQFQFDWNLSLIKITEEVFEYHKLSVEKFQRLALEETDTRCTSSHIQTGWAPLNLAPSLLIYSKHTRSGQLNVDLLQATSIARNKLKFFTKKPCTSYETQANIFRPEQNPLSKEFVPLNYEELFEYYKEILYNEAKERSYFYSTEPKRSLMKPISPNISGKEFYELVKDTIVNKNYENLETIRTLIREGADINYVDPETGQDSLIISSGGIHALYPGLVETFMERADTNYLVLDNKGKSASFYAMGCEDTPDITDKLIQKKLDQSDEAGFDPDRPLEMQVSAPFVYQPD